MERQYQEIEALRAQIQADTARHAQEIKDAETRAANEVCANSQFLRALHHPPSDLSQMFNKWEQQMNEEVSHAIQSHCQISDQKFETARMILSHEYPNGASRPVHKRVDPIGELYLAENFDT
jgi:hypothetical protein